MSAKKETRPPIELILKRIETEGSCLKFLAQMAYISISTYLHQRKLVAEGALKRVRVNGQLSFFTFRKETRWGKKLSGLVLGITDAISMKYLRQAILMINEDPSRPDVVTEVFSISLAYTEEDCFQIVDKDGRQIASLSWKGEEHFVEQLDSVLHKLVYAIRRLEPFGECKPHPIVKLTYYERTPPDYEPVGFSRCTDYYTFDDRPQRVALGQLVTRFGTAVFDIQSAYIKDRERIQEAESMADEIEDFERFNGTVSQNNTILNTTLVSLEKSRVEEPGVITIKSSVNKQNEEMADDEEMHVEAPVASSPKSYLSEASDKESESSAEKSGPSNRSEASSEESSVEKSPVPKRITRARRQAIEQKKEKEQENLKRIYKKKAKKPTVSRRVSFSPTGNSPIRGKAPDYRLLKNSIFARSISMSTSDRDDYSRR